MERHREFERIEKEKNLYKLQVRVGELRGMDIFEFIKAPASLFSPPPDVNDANMEDSTSNFREDFQRLEGERQPKEMIMSAQELMDLLGVYLAKSGKEKGTMSCETAISRQMPAGVSSSSESYPDLPSGSSLFIDPDSCMWPACPKLEDLLGILVEGFQLVQPRPLPPILEVEFKQHLFYLTSAVNSTSTSFQQAIPSLYHSQKTFWLPSSSLYLASVSPSSAHTPTSHRFFYWDPLLLVFNGIACTICNCPLSNLGPIRSGPIMVYDFTGPFYIIGCSYICTNSHLYASTEHAVFCTLPEKLQYEFPAHLLASEVGTEADIWSWKARGVSRAVWN
ncbi:hypothetical protein R3P38DRAFT_2967174 [Favolaschia claudopus]|uniref:Uncharacterized protein n=1 Tax=Favolaschia claudopus TaxID=2862362 RepID=A0AAW0B6E8_9AGAR